MYFLLLLLFVVVVAGSSRRGNLATKGTKNVRLKEGGSVCMCVFPASSSSGTDFCPIITTEAFYSSYSQSSRHIRRSREGYGGATAEQQLAKSVFPVRGEHCPPDHSPSIPFFERFLNVGSSFPCE